MQALYHVTLNSGHCDIVPRESVSNDEVNSYCNSMRSATFCIQPPKEIFYDGPKGHTAFKTKTLPPLIGVHDEHAGWSSVSIMCDDIILLRLVTAWSDKTAALQSLGETRTTLEERYQLPVPTYPAMPSFLPLPLSALLILPSPASWQPIYRFLGRAVDAISFAHLQRVRGKSLEAIVGKYWRN